MAGLDAGADRPVPMARSARKPLADAMAQPAAPRVAHHGDAEMHLGRRRALRRRDGIEPWPQRRQRAQQIGQRRARGRKCLQQVEQIGVRRFGAVLALRQRAQSGGMARMRRSSSPADPACGRAGARCRDALVEHGRRHRSVSSPDRAERGQASPRPAPDRSARRGSSESPGVVGQARIAQIDDDMADVLAGAGPVSGRLASTRTSRPARRRRRLRQRRLRAAAGASASRRFSAELVGLAPGTQRLIELSRPSASAAA